MSRSRRGTSVVALVAGLAALGMLVRLLVRSFDLLALALVGAVLIVAALGRSDTDTQGTPHEVAPPNVTLVAHGRDPDDHGNRQ